MGTDTVAPDSSLLELLNANANTDLTPSERPDPHDAPERRDHQRYEPVEQLTLRLDVMGEIWSARVREISAGSACLQVDREIADRLKNDQPASIWLESTLGIPVRLDGSLRTLRDPADTAPDEPVSMAFTRTM